MTAVFADTGFYVAITNLRDGLHARAMSFMTGFKGQIVTTEFVLTEVGNFFSRSNVRSAFVELLTQIRVDPRTRIIASASPLFEKGAALFAARPDKDWSLTDCISFSMMSDLGITDALTADHHFEQAGFRALLK